jgi:predicted Zn-dependent peptidase
MDFDTRFTTLVNGLDVLALRRPGTSTATLCLDVHVGSRYEGPADSGLSHLLEHMLFQGSAAHGPPADINRAAESMGAALGGSTSRDSTRLEHWVSADALSESAALMAGLVASPRFEDLETERQIVIEEALEEFDETGRRTDAETLSRQAAWADAPLGAPIVGALEALERFGVDDLHRHHQRHYGAANMQLTVVGPDAPDALIETVADAFGTLRAGERVTPAEAPSSFDGPAVVRVNDTGAQCECRLLFHTPGRHSETALALSLARLVIDDGMASRLHQRLGAELGLAYDQWAMWESYPDTGLFELGALVSPDKVETFFTEAQQLARSLSRKPPAGEELERLRFRTRWAFESAVESPEGLINAYAMPHFYEEKIRCPAALLEALLAVTADQIAAAADAHFRATEAVLTCVGPMSKGTRRALRALPRRWT